MSTLETRLGEFIGKDVYIEGTFPLPTPEGVPVYSPYVGKLTGVYTNGHVVMVDVLAEGETEPGLYALSTIRSIRVIKKSGIVQPRRSGILT